MHERLSASTDFKPVRPEVANDKRGPGSDRAGIVGTGGEAEGQLFFKDSSEGVKCESLLWTPSTNARNFSSGDEGKSPLWDEGSRGTAVGRDKMEETECGIIAVFIDSPGVMVDGCDGWDDRVVKRRISEEGHQGWLGSEYRF